MKHPIARQRRPVIMGRVRRHPQPARLFVALGVLTAVAILTTTAHLDLSGSDETKSRGEQRLAELVRDTSAATRAAAIYSLSQNEHLSSPIVRTLSRALEDRDEAVRDEAIAALLRLAVADTAHVHLIVRGASLTLMLGETDARIAAAHVLGGLHSRARGVEAQVIRTLRDSSSAVRIAGAAALGNEIAHDQEAFRALRDAAARDRDAGVRAAALESLARLAPTAWGEPSGGWTMDDCVALRGVAQTALNDSSARVREQASFALASLGATGAAASVPLARSLHDESASVRRAAAYALDSVGKTIAWVRDSLRIAATDRNIGVERAAEASLAALAAPSTSSARRPRD